MAKRKGVSKISNKRLEADWAQPRFEDVVFCITGRLEHCKKADATNLIEAEGGSVAKSVNAKVNYLIVGQSRGGKLAAEKKAVTLNKKGASIMVLDETAFHTLMAPDPKHVVEMLKAGSTGKKFWNQRYGQDWLKFQLEITGAKLANLDLSQLFMRNVIFKNSNFTGSKLTGATFHSAENCKFDRAHLDLSLKTAADCTFRSAKIGGLSIDEKAIRCNFQKAAGAFLTGSFFECDLSKAKIESAWINDADDCNFTGATLSESNFGLERFTDKYSGNNFEKAKIVDTDLSHNSFFNSNFNGADFQNSLLYHATFEECTFARAKFKNADLNNSDLIGADLTGADLRGAKLFDANLTDARIYNADFRNAITTGIELGGVDVSTAKGLQVVAPVAAGTIGANVRKFQATANKSGNLGTEIQVTTEDNLFVLRVGGAKGYTTASVHDLEDTYWSDQNQPLADLMLAVAGRAKGNAELSTVSVSRSACPMKPKECKALAIRAWCEVFGLPFPTAKELNEQQADLKARQAAATETLLNELRGGKKGIAKWNARSESRRTKLAKFAGADLAGVDLRGAHLESADFRQADLTGAKLGTKDWPGLFRADFSQADLSHASFLDEISSLNFQEANLQNARLSTIEIERCDFEGANLNETDFANAEFSACNFKGADLSKAILTNATYWRMQYDQATKFPKGFEVTADFEWAGKGNDPRLVKKAEKRMRRKKRSISFEEFMQELEESFDASRLKKATKMLKGDSFQLFAEVSDDAVVGVVKSQTSDSLIYACRLNSQGEFSCCTHKLNRCGGLRGALCKHLLVLIIGLTKAEELKAVAAMRWVIASTLNEPALNKDAASEVLLKYKGAEAGEIDWRPTETVPEDYYAF